MNRSMGLIATLGLGWFLYEYVSMSLWIEVGWWLLIGVGVLAGLLVLLSVLGRRAMDREFERNKRMVDRDRHGMKPVQPQIVYMSLPVQPQHQQMMQLPAGLMDLPIEKYEWEVG